MTLSDMRLSQQLFMIMMLSGVLILPLWGCSSTPQTTAKSQAEAIYQQGVEALENEDFLTAAERFRTVKTKFLFSPYAALSELRLADTAFEQKQFYEAIETYRLFIQTRPNHAEVPYAYWKIGAAHAAQRPDDFFILPPSYERDRGPTKDALRALQTYLDLYPKHQYAPEATKLVQKCRADLGAYELYVARFYRSQGKLEAARGRYEIILERFKDVQSLWRESAGELVEVYEDLKLESQATELKGHLRAGG